MMRREATEVVQGLFPVGGLSNERDSLFFPSTPASATLLLTPSSPSGIQTKCNWVNRPLRKHLKARGFENGPCRACVSSPSPFLQLSHSRLASGLNIRSPKRFQVRAMTSSDI